MPDEELDKTFTRREADGTVMNCKEIVTSTGFRFKVCSERDLDTAVHDFLDALALVSSNATLSYRAPVAGKSDGVEVKAEVKEEMKDAPNTNHKRQRRTSGKPATDAYDYSI